MIKPVLLLTAVLGLVSCALRNVASHPAESHAWAVTETIVDDGAVAVPVALNDDTVVEVVDATQPAISEQHGCSDGSCGVQRRGILGLFRRR